MNLRWPSQRALREIGIIAAIVAVVSIVVRTFLFQVFYVPSVSMNDTLQVNDKIVASKFALTTDGIRRGDVVVFHDPGGWLAVPPQPNALQWLFQRPLEIIGLLPNQPGEDLVKRVIGVAGDHVVCCNPAGRIMVNGHALDERSYTLGDSSAVPFDIRVPDHRIFVMGDNRHQSADSRFHLDVESGTVDVGEVRGIVIATIWPISRFGSVPAPAALTSAALNQPIS